MGLSIYSQVSLGKVAKCSRRTVQVKKFYTKKHFKGSGAAMSQYTLFYRGKVRVFGSYISSEAVVRTTVVKELLEVIRSDDQIRDTRE